MHCTWAHNVHSAKIAGRNGTFKNPHLMFSKSSNTPRQTHTFHLHTLLVEYNIPFLFIFPPPTHLNIPTYIHTLHTYAYIHTCIHTTHAMYVHDCVCVHICVCMPVYVDVCVCTCACVHVTCQALYAYKAAVYSQQTRVTIQGSLLEQIVDIGGNFVMSRTEYGLKGHGD